MVVQCVDSVSHGEQSENEARCAIISELERLNRLLLKEAHLTDLCFARVRTGHFFCARQAAILARRSADALRCNGTSSSAAAPLVVAAAAGDRDRLRLLRRGLRLRLRSAAAGGG